MQTTHLPTGKNAVYLNALPFLNVLPLDEQKLDLWVLNTIGAELPVQLIASLLKQQSFEVGIDLNDRKEESKERRDQFRALQGTFERFASKKRLAIGYPMLLLEDAALGRDIAAPLFIWELDLQDADDEKAEHWVLSYDAERSMKFNEILKNYLIARFDLDWEQLMGDPKDLKAKHLLAALNRLAVALQIAQPDLPKLFMCPNPNQPATSKNAILWAGMLGEFEPSPEDAEDLPLSLQPRDSRSWNTRVAALSLNTMQEEALEAIFNSEEIVLSGESGTGKSRTLAAMMPGVLADQGSCLIISEKGATLKELKYQLEQTGLKDLGILLLQDQDLDKESFLNYLAALPNYIKQTPKFDENRYQLLLHQFLEKRQHLVEGYNAMQKETLEKLDWTNAVGRFMQYHLQDGKQYLSRLLDTSDFDWSELEFEELKTALAQHEVLYNKVRNLHHPLIALKEYIFTEKSKTEASDFVHHELRLLSRMLRDLYQDYTTFIDSYADDLRFHYESHVKDLKYRVGSLVRELKIYQEVYGNSFDNIGSFNNTRLRIMSVFSRKHQQIRAAKEKIYLAYDALKELYESKRYFDHGLDPIRSYSNLGDIAEDLKSFESAANFWFKRIPKIVARKVKELTIKLPLKPELKRQLEDLEQQLDTYLEQLKTKNILIPDFKVNSLKATAREAYLRDLLEMLMVLENSLPEFDAFYDWYKNWLELGHKGQSLVKALVAVRPKSWQTAFKSWYYYHYLDRQYSLQLPDRPFPLDQYLEVSKELKPILFYNSLMITRGRQQEALRLLRKEKNLNPTQARGQFQTLPLKVVLDWFSIEQLTALFPIIIASPDMADQLFDKLPLFDLIVLEDAHLLDEQKGRRLSKLGAQRLVLGRKVKGEKNYLNKMLASSKMQQFELKQEYSKDAKAIASIAVDHQGPKELQEALYQYLMRYLPQERLQKAVEVEKGVVIDLVVKPLSANAAPIAIVIDGWMKSVGKYDYQKALDRAERLKNKGYVCHALWSIDCWKQPDKAIQDLVAFILNWDRETTS
jgi:hypothetical protein